MCLPGTTDAVRAHTDRHGLPAVSRRALLAGGAGAAAGALLAPGRATANGGGRHGGPRVADLTHLFREGFPVYVGDSADRSPLNDLATDGFYAQQWTFGEHTGTHLDAPGHFTAGGRLVPQLRPEEFFAPIAVIDIAARAAADPDTVVTVDDLRAYERRHGRIPKRAAVLMSSGWDARAGDDAAFKNVDAAGGFHFPGFSEEAAAWLLARRDAAIIGVDTLSLDPGNAAVFTVHVTWLGADRFGLEGLAGLGTIPPAGAELVVGIVPFEEGSGGPCRVLARY
jgi:kynurenine formamidase